MNKYKNDIYYRVIILNFIGEKGEEYIVKESRGTNK